MFVIFIMNLVHQECQSVVEASQLLEFLPSVKFNDGDDYQGDDHDEQKDSGLSWLWWSEFYQVLYFQGNIVWAKQTQSLCVFVYVSPCST